MTRAARPYDVVKRALDILGALVGIILTAPLQAAVALVVLVALGRPVLFRQRRPGREGRIFTLVKFRTMKPPRAGADDAEDAQRLTRVGRFLRGSSLDELPTLFNVLRGDMSFVGPRPLLERYLELYTPQEARRHEVRPGVTGLAQVEGRNAVAWEQRFALDVEYVDRRSLGLDLRILLRTVVVVLTGRGVSAPGHVTVEGLRREPRSPSDSG